MGWIKRRINKEKLKHEGKLDWSLCAEKKIISQLKTEWREKCKRMKIMSGDVAIFELERMLDGNGN